MSIPDVSPPSLVGPPALALCPPCVEYLGIVELVRDVPGTSGPEEYAAAATISTLSRPLTSRIHTDLKKLCATLPQGAADTKTVSDFPLLVSPVTTAHTHTHTHTHRHTYT